MKASLPCNQPRCPNLQPCSDHPKVPWKGSTRRSSLPPDWESRRRAALERDPICTCPGCRSCSIPGVECERPSTEADHVGHRTDHDQLAGRCTSCHQHRTNRQATRARRTTD